ncbi:DDE-type integrase/transposase/recombinase [Dyadobacter sp. 32]|uniref:DDE-type integrase/transposase/recombinase n=1 Tax=Dyadobacter sp. 32 TaxID=538966 RepID=UPI0011EE8D92
MPQLYRSYHSQFKIEYGKGSLPDAVSTHIPRSTRAAWKNKNADSFWNPIAFESQKDDDLLIARLKTENKLLKKQLKIAFQLVLLYRQLLALIPVKNSHFVKIKKRTTWLLQTCQKSSLDRAIWRYLPFTHKQWGIWNGRKQCWKSLLGLCRKQNTQQLAVTEQEIIATACVDEKYTHWPLVSIYYHLMREEKLHCCKSTFYKYCRLLNITRKPIRKPRNYKPLSSIAPFKILHQDVTIFRTTNGVKHYIYVIRDNFSRAILACQASTVYNSDIAKQTLESVLQKFDLLNQAGSLITDDGSENKGELTKWLASSATLWKKIVAQVDIVQSNSMVEAANKIIKYRYLFPKPIIDTSELTKTMAQAIENFNDMPSGSLHGLTPNEVLNGAIPNKHFFKIKIQQAKQDRIETNRRITCDSICQT